MVFSRVQFLAILSLLILGPFFVPRLIWLINSRKAIGKMEFVGHDNLGSALGISSYPVIMFIANNDTFHFNGSLNIPLADGQTVPIRYQKFNPADAKIDSFLGIWGDTLAYAAAPLLIMICLAATRDLAPNGWMVSIKRRPMIRTMK